MGTARLVLRCVRMFMGVFIIQLEEFLFKAPVTLKTAFCGKIYSLPLNHRDQWIGSKSMQMFRVKFSFGDTQ